jgi:hypothetical protein
MADPKGMLSTFRVAGSLTWGQIFPQEAGGSSGSPAANLSTMGYSVWSSESFPEAVMVLSYLSHPVQTPWSNMTVLFAKSSHPSGCQLVFS